MGAWITRLGCAGLVLLSSCAGGTGDASAPSGPATWTLSAEPRLTIGQTEGEQEYLLNGISAAAFLPDGGIAVADQHGTTIKIFRADGTFVRQFGRPGKGPGEFGSINGLFVASPDTIIAFDRFLFRLSRFLVSDSLISTKDIQADDGRPELFLGRYSNEDLAVAWISFESFKGRSQKHPDIMKVARFSATDGHLVAHVGSLTGLVRLAAGAVEAFSPTFHGGMIGDSLVVTNGLRPELQVWGPEGGLVRTIPVGVPDVNPAEAWKELDQEIAARGTACQRRWRAQQPEDQEIPRLSTMWVDHRGRIWVKPYEPATDNTLMGSSGLGGARWILDANGRVLAKLILPDGLQLLDVLEDRLLGTTRDQLGVEQIVVYNVIEQ